MLEKLKKPHKRVLTKNYEEKCMMRPEDDARLAIISWAVLVAGLVALYFNPLMHC